MNVIKNKDIIKLNFLVFTLILLLFAQIYSYSTSQWTIIQGEYSIIKNASKIATTDFITVFLRYLALFFVLFFSLIENRKRWFVYTTVFILLISLHCFRSLNESVSFQSAIYSSSFPAIYLIIIAFFSGLNDKHYQSFSAAITFLLILYLSLFSIEFAVSFHKYGWIIYSNSSVLNYFSHLFWSCACYCLIRFEKRKKQNYALFILLIVCAILIRSRSWIIQSFLLILVFGFNDGKKNSLGKALKRIVTILIVGFLVFLISYLAFPQFLNALFEKGLTDTRSFQYVEMLSEMDFLDWLFGKGEYATYSSKLYGDYSYIDNQFLNITFHYGVVLSLLVFWPILFTIYKCIKYKALSHSFIPFLGITILWFLSLNGLSVYNTITIDVKNLIMFYTLGHILGACHKEEIDYHEQNLVSKQ